MRILKILYISFSTIIIFLSSVQAATISFLIGNVKFNRGSDWKDAKLGMVLSQGDSIKTGSKSLVIITISQDTIIKTGSDTILKFENLDIKKEEKTLLSLLEGRVFSKIIRKNAQKDFRIATPTLMASVRGTEFFVAYGRETNKSRDIWLCVNEGKVRVDSLITNKSVVVNEGKGIFILGGEEITEPKEYEWTEGLNWNMDPDKGEVINRTQLEDIYTDLLDQDYD